MIVRAEDLREARARYGGFCATGTLAWFKRHGLSFRKFMSEGLPIEQVRVDEFGDRVAMIALERKARDGQQATRK